MSGSRSMAGCDEVVAEWPAPLRGAGGLTPGRGTWRGPRLPASGSSAPARGAAYRSDISHSCRSPASAARCSGSIVPAVLSAPNTGLRQPHEQTAWAPPSPASWMVVWWSTAIGVLEVNDRAAYRPRHAVEGLDPGGCRLRSGSECTPLSRDTHPTFSGLFNRHYGHGSCPGPGRYRREGVDAPVTAGGGAHAG